MGHRSIHWFSVFTLTLALVAATLGVLSFAQLVRVNAPWILIAGAAILGIVGVKTRLTLLDQAEALGERQAQIELLQTQLAEQRNSVDALADGLDVALFITDPRAQILYANRRARELFAFAQPVGRSVLAVTLSYDLEQLVVEAHRLGQTRQSELSFTYPEERIAIAKTWTPANESSRVFLSLIEISDLRRLERIRRDFVANVSHELRTPMTVIRAMAETLLDDTPADDERATRYLSKITDEVDRLSAMTQDLLVLTAAESNPVRKQACNIAEVFQSVVQQLTSKATEKSLTLTYKGPTECTIEANAAQMTQVALNLVENAIKYTNEGSVSIEVTLNGPTVEIQIEDTGLGIAVEHQARIFERFYRVDRGRSRSSGGTGLGLSIVKHIVEAHGGTLTVKSALNKGSTFVVTLPAEPLVDGPR